MTLRVRDLQLGHKDASSDAQHVVGKLPVRYSLERKTLK